MAMYIDFATAPYADQANQMAMLFFYSGLGAKTKKRVPRSGITLFDQPYTFI